MPSPGTTLDEPARRREAVGHMVPVRMQKGDLLGGKYRIDGVIGEGAMGVVVSAWHIDLQQRVAIKFLHPLLADREDSVERFLREARAVVRIVSEHVARVLDVGRVEGAEPYLVMEYLEGLDLAATLQRRGALPLVEAVTYLQQACEAIAEAHAAGIIHRDLKPANLFLVDRGTEPARVKVLDFGISKMPAAQDRALLTNTTVVMGSPLYMSPEQLRSTRDVDEKADIWALGVILYEMLTGTEPFSAQSLPQLCAIILEGSPLAPRSIRPEIPAELERIVLRCLAKIPAARFSSVAELSGALIPFGSADAEASAERAARSLRRTGGRLTPAPPSQAPKPPHRLSLWLALGAGVVSSLLLLRNCLSDHKSPTSVASAEPRAPTPEAAPVAKPTVHSDAPTVEATASSAPLAVASSAARERVPPPAAARTAARPLTAAPTARTPTLAGLSARAASPDPHRAPTSQRTGADPQADNFGGRE